LVVGNVVVVEVLLSRGWGSGIPIGVCGFTSGIEIICVGDKARGKIVSILVPDFNSTLSGVYGNNSTSWKISCFCTIGLCWGTGWTTGIIGNLFTTLGTAATTLGCGGV
jgi:hypothetical protein